MIGFCETKTHFPLQHMTSPMLGVSISPTFDFPKRPRPRYGSPHSNNSAAPVVTFCCQLHGFLKEQNAPKNSNLLEGLHRSYDRRGVIFYLFQDCSFFFEAEFGFACSMLGKLPNIFSQNGGLIMTYHGKK